MQNSAKHSNKIKVLVLSHISDLLGGAERSMLDVFDHWTKHYNIEPQFIIREPIKALATALDKRGWKYYHLRYTFWSDSRPPKYPEEILVNAAHNSKAVTEIQNIIAKTKPDIVMTNSIVCPWAALAANYQRMPHVWFVREYGDLDHGRIFEIGREKTWQDVGNLSDLVVTISKSLAEHAANYIDKQKLAILYNPFKIDEIKQRAAQKTPSPFKSQSCLKTIILGNLAPTKGQLQAIEAVAELNRRGHDTEICIVGQTGETEYMQAIHNAIARHNIGNKVHMLGFKTNPLMYVAMADVGIMASKREGFGRSTFEYLAIGKPVVGANSGATPEMVLEGKTGYLFDPAKPSSLVDALEHYAKNKDLIIEHGQNAAKHAAHMMSGPQNVDALYKKIEAIAREGSSSTPVPINFNQRWMEYVELAERTLKHADAFSLKAMAKVRVRQKIKPAYIKLRNIKTRMLGK